MYCGNMDAWINWKSGIVCLTDEETEKTFDRSNSGDFRQNK